MHYGGAIFIKYSLITNETVEVLGYYGNDPLTSFTQWDIPETLTIMNTNFVLAHLPSVGFQNVLITSSYPGINQKLNLRFKNFLNITYRNPISQSSENVSIYQIYNNDTKQLQLRQTFSGLSNCLILNDNITISCPILPSTFNVPTASYMIVVDNGFVQDSGLQEQIRGIGNGLWTVQTESRDSPYIYSEPITGTLRLSEDGTIYYNNLTSNQKSLFLMSLRDELASSIPTDSSRLLFSGRTNIDLTTPAQQILFELIISDTKDLFQPNSDQIRTDFNALIENKYITILSTLPHTTYIDDKHKFESIPNLLNELLNHKHWIIGVGIVSIFLIIFPPITTCPHKKKCQLKDDCVKLQDDDFSAKQCRASLLFTSCLSLFHLFLNILFIMENAKDVSYLYLPSITFFSIGIGLDTIFAFAIFTRKFSNYYFNEWLILNLKWAALFTLLSSADIEVLLLLNSHLGGFEIFNAPFTKEARDYIFWCKVSTIFINSIPWLIIQVRSDEDEKISEVNNEEMINSNHEINYVEDNDSQNVGVNSTNKEEKIDDTNSGHINNDIHELSETIEATKQDLEENQDKHDTIKPLDDLQVFKSNGDYTSETSIFLNKNSKE
ncbi:13080_t:CDS:10 [Cetraspora pellucida]|uniref:13080_t:CDS:1 n=1 Tax=Cetraspora pellucida TaxID=1433469 RepID=A0A9N8W3U4_9GLOM|nr:13080_t:CDS:10 [Cetraspora pellucida]